jgi:hypothetical protein
MRRSQRLIAATVLIALSSALAGCSSVYNWDPTDMLDFLDTKKKLPGERKRVFPEGVPGLEQGVPKELYKGSAQERLDQQNAQATAAAAAPPAEDPKSKRAAKGKGKPPAAAGTAPAQEPSAAADPDATPEEDGSTAAAPPAPKPKKIARKRTTAPPPDQSAAQQPQQSAAPFPAPIPSGTFTR